MFFFILKNDSKAPIYICHHVNLFLSLPLFYLFYFPVVFFYVSYRQWKIFIWMAKCSIGFHGLVFNSVTSIYVSLLIHISSYNMYLSRCLWLISLFCRQCWNPVMAEITSFLTRKEFKNWFHFFYIAIFICLNFSNFVLLMFFCIFCIMLYYLFLTLQF